MNLTTATAALADQVTAVSGLRMSTVVPAKINPPHGFVERASLDYLLDYSPVGMRASFTLTVVVGSAGFDRGQELLDEYLSSEGDKSVLAAVHSDPTLGGACDFALVRGVREVGEIDVRDSRWIGARFEVEVVG